MPQNSTDLPSLVNSPTSKLDCMDSPSIFLPEGFDPKEVKREKNKEESHPFICNLLYIFFLPFVCRISPVTKQDIYEVSKEDRTELNAKKVSLRWNKRMESYAKDFQQYLLEKESNPSSKMKEPSKPSLMRTLVWELNDYKLVLAFVFMLIACGISLAQPELMEIMLEIVEEREEAEEAGEEGSGFPYAAGIILVICPLANSIFTALGMRFVIHFVARMRASLACLIFDTTMKSSRGGQTGEEKGHLLSLLSSDVGTVADMTLQAFYIIQMPFRMIVSFIFVVLNFGVVSLVAIAIFAISIPFQFLSANALIKAMRQYMLINDERNKATNELFQGIRVVKCNGLEGLFVKRIESIRQRQLPSIFSITTFHQIYMSVMHTVPHYLAVASFATYIAVQNVPQSRFAVDVMPTVEYLELMAEPAVNLPMYLQAAMMAVVSLGRIRDYLYSNNNALNKKHDQEEDKEKNKNINSEQNIDIDINITNGYFEWERKQDKNVNKISNGCKSSNIDDDQCVLQGINLNIKRGSLTIVVGSVGSGKSSLGLSLIGEMKVKKGILDVNGSVAYCPQNAWITSNSVKGNILFGNAYNESRYKQTIKVCGLEKDLSILPAGDDTAVGERGVNMSGGQKARIQLARAVYSDRDIYILDDPLSAVDVYVGHLLFEQCIDGMLKGKTRILLSNGILEHHAIHADQIIILENGKIIGSGSIDEIKQQGIDIHKYMRMKNETLNFASEFCINKQDEQNETLKSKTASTVVSSGRSCIESNKNEGSDVQKQIQRNTGRRVLTGEEQATGTIPIRAYLDYARSLAPYLIVFLLLILSASAEAMCLVADYWVGVIGEVEQYSNISYWMKV
ncbi:MAG: putative Multidrug resistance-associated protein 1, partial [Streblomastix strix]